MGIVRYINLDNAPERRLAIEQCFARVPMSRWKASRLAAIGADDLRTKAIPGWCRPAEKACFLSHREALFSSSTSLPNEHIHILEDDALIGTRTYEILDNFLASDEIKRWDLIFTDIIVTRLQTMIDLIAIRREAIRNHRIDILDLKNFEFAGLTSYVVNSSSLKYLKKLLQSVEILNQPIDLVFRHWIHTGQLRACVLFPFTTTVSHFAASSQIQMQENLSTTRIWDAFRNLVWIEREFSQATSIANDISKHTTDLESNIMGMICASMVSPQFKII